MRGDIEMETGKVEVESSVTYRILHPRLVVLVSCVDKAGKANVITLAWSMPVSIDPPFVAISIAPRRYSHELIKETKEFVVNLPTINLVRETLFCGRVSGRDHDKFEEAKLTPLPAKIVKSPLINECVAHLECKLHKQITVGDHTLFIGEVVAAHVNEGVFRRGYDLQKVKLVYHCGGDNFVTVVPEIVTPRL